MNKRTLKYTHCYLSIRIQYHILALYVYKPSHVFRHFEKNDLEILPHIVSKKLLGYIRGSGIRFNVSFTHSRTILYTL